MFWIGLEKVPFYHLTGNTTKHTVCQDLIRVVISCCCCVYVYNSYMFWIFASSIRQLWWENTTSCSWHMHCTCETHQSESQLTCAGHGNDITKADLLVGASTNEESGLTSTAGSLIRRSGVICSVTSDERRAACFSLDTVQKPVLVRVIFQALHSFTVSTWF